MLENLERYPGCFENDECFSFGHLRPLESDECFSFWDPQPLQINECFSFWHLRPLESDECFSCAAAGGGLWGALETLWAFIGYVLAMLGLFYYGILFSVGHGSVSRAFMPSHLSPCVFVPLNGPYGSMGQGVYGPRPSLVHGTRLLWAPNGHGSMGLWAKALMGP